MKANQKNVSENTGAKNTDREVDVLYQRMGDRWFAFSLVDDEVFFGSISPEEIAALDRGETPQSRRKIAGNS